MWALLAEAKGITGAAMLAARRKKGAIKMRNGSGAWRGIVAVAVAGLLLAGTATAAPLLAGSDLVGYWKFDEPVGNPRDAATGLVNGTLSGTVARVTGKFCGAFNFAGVNDYVSIANSTVLENVQEGDYTLSAWVNADTVPPGSDTNNANYGIIEKAGYHSGLRYSSASRFTADAWRAAGPTNYSATTTTTYTPGTWNHVVAVVSRTNGTMKVYVNGEEKGSNTFTPGAAAYQYNQTPWRIGIANPGAGTYRWPMDGTIDEVAIWKKALTADEVGTLYQLYSGASAFPTVVADYQTNFQGPTPSPGWQYLWNANGAIGNMANYVPLLWTGSAYDSDGVPGSPAVPPGRYVSLTGTGGHPGPAAAQTTESLGIERYAIAAYSVPFEADYFMTDSILAMTNGSRTVGTHTLELRVYVDDLLLYREIGIDNTSFMLSLGHLFPGNNILVALGANGSDAYDSFRLDFAIVTTSDLMIPEPATATLLVGGLAALAARRRRKRRHRSPRTGGRDMSRKSMLIGLLLLALVAGLAQAAPIAVYDSYSDWQGDGVQPDGRWYYEQVLETDLSGPYGPLPVWDTGSWRFTLGSVNWGSGGLSQSGGHPGFGTYENYDVIATFSPDTAGIYLLVGNVRHNRLDTGGSDGVELTIRHDLPSGNDEVYFRAWPIVRNPGSGAIKRYGIGGVALASLSSPDELYFRVSAGPNSNSGTDSFMYRYRVYQFAPAPGGSAISHWDSVAQFGNNVPSTDFGQLGDLDAAGNPVWFYQSGKPGSSNPNDYHLLSEWDATNQRWITVPPADGWPSGSADGYVQHFATGCHPGTDDNHAAIRSWLALFDGTVDLSFWAADSNPSGGDGVTMAVYLNDVLLGLQLTIANGDSVGKTIELADVPVQFGDFLHFAILPGLTAGADGTNVRIEISTEVIPEPATLSLLAAGLVGLAARRRRRR